MLLSSLRELAASCCFAVCYWAWLDTVRLEGGWWKKESPPDHRKRTKRLAKRTYLDSDTYALSGSRSGDIYRIPPMPNYSQAQINAMSPPIPDHRRERLHRVLLAIFLVVAVAYLLTFQM